MRKLLFLFFIGCIAVVAAQGQTSAERKILTADDFKADLRPGAAFCWSQVHPRASRVKGQKEFAEIQTAKARYSNSHLLLGQLYAAAGLLDEAEREFRALQQANPESAVAKQLLADVRKLKR